MNLNFKLCSFLADKSQSRFFVTAVFPAICALSFTGECSAATTLFSDTFDRSGGTGGNNLNFSTTGKTGTLAPLNWTERVTNGAPADDVDIVSDNLVMQAGTTSTTGGVAYVDHNFIGYTSITVAFDYVLAPTSGSIRQLGFGIGNTKAALDALTSSGAFGRIRISYDLATSLAPIGETGVQVIETGGTTTYIPRTIATGDTLSATFTFADMNAGSTINYEVFHGGVSIHTGDHTWADTDTNYIGLFNTHTTGSGDSTSIDNFVVSTIPEPSSALLGGLGLLALLPRRR